MKFGVTTNFDRARGYGIMWKQNHLESNHLKRLSRCAR
jgi:hypothetical protein